MQIVSPTWRLKRLCPVCEEAACLAFTVCPTCGWLAVRCDEEGTPFLNPHDLSSGGVAPPADLPCPGCGKTTLRDFVWATDEEIVRAGFSAEDYE